MVMERLKRWLEDTGRTQKQLCEMLLERQDLELTPGAISQYINGVSDPSIDTLKALSVVTGLTTDELLFGVPTTARGRSRNVASTAGAGK